MFRNLYLRYFLLLTNIACGLAISFKPATTDEKYTVAIKKITDQLQERKYKAELQVTFFNNYTSINPLDKKEIIISVYDKYIHYKAGPAEAFATPNYYLAIDHKDKTLIVNTRIKNKKEKSNPIDPLFLDSIIGLAYNPQLLATTPTSKTWRITPAVKGHSIAYADFTYNTSNYTPKKIVIYYNIPLEKLFRLFPFQKNNEEVNRKQKPKLVIDYQVFEILSKSNLNSFDFSNFITFNNGKPEKGPLSSGYKLIDFTTTKNKKS